MGFDLLTPLQRYQADLRRPDFVRDPAQQRAVELLDQLYHRLVEAEAEYRARGSMARLLDRLRPGSSTTPITGLYFWGGVGRGKTYLMDTFYEALPFERKLRAHFHHFMRRVHAELRSLAGEKNPLDQVARRLASEARVICFDEFFVSDITDVMLLGTLFQRLFGLGVTLVATSNIVPDELYRDGLQRQRFLPAIELIKRHTRVVNVDGGVDYRLRHLEPAAIYHAPLGPEAEASLQRSWQTLADGEAEGAVELMVEGRPMRARRVAETVAWFHFAALCDGPRSQYDYLELARRFQAVLISDVPRLDRRLDDQARRFISLVDEFYDRQVTLVLSAEVPLEELYAGGGLEFEFERTRSRLLEMQSREYLERPHRGGAAVEARSA